MNKNKTIIINLLGSSGSGKSTSALGLTYELKKLGYKCEIAREYVKEEIFTENFKVLHDQIFIFANQNRIQKNLANKELDFVISESPLILSSFYR